MKIRSLKLQELSGRPSNPCKPCRFCRKNLIILLFLCIPGAGFPGLKGQDAGDVKGIWFNNCNSTAKRFLYSQSILWPSAIAGHAYVYITEDIRLDEAFSWSQYKETFTKPPVWDRDHWSWNYEVHPIMGSFTYLSYRNKKAYWAEAIAGTALNSLIYEYIIAGGTQQPSLNDMITTPVLGSLLGEGIYQVKKMMVRDKRLTTIEKIILTVTDPFEVMNLGFNYRKLAAKAYR